MSRVGRTVLSEQHVELALPKTPFARILDEIVNELGKGNRLECRDFGVFETKIRKARKAQNPKTLEPVAVPEKRTVKFTWHEKSATQGYWQTTYPAVLNRCEMCHLAGTYDFSTAAMTTALPNMLYSTVGQGTYAASPANSPYVKLATDYGAGFTFNAVTGVSTPPASTTLVNSPITAACSACHDSPAAVDHMQTNGGSFWEPRSTALTKPQQEECLICHGPNRIAAISLVHLDKTP